MLSSEELILQAKEDLKLLETNHPNRFEYLKLELKSFITFLESQPLLIPPYSFDDSIFLPNSCSQLVSTQASICEKNNGKRSSYYFETEEMEEQDEEEDSRHEFREVEIKKMKKDRVDLVLEKSQSCLHKIQQVKASLC